MFNKFSFETNLAKNKIKKTFTKKILNFFKGVLLVELIKK